MQSFPRVDVAGIGINATDTLIELPHFPAPDSKVEFTRDNVMLGGQVASAVIACSIWGLTTRYVGKVGEDEAAGLHARAFAKFGVEAHLLPVPGARSQSAYILVDQRTSERTILWRRDPRIALAPADLRREWVTQSKVLLVDGHDAEAAACAATWAGEAGVPVVADVDNLYAGVESLLRKTDYLICSKEFPGRLTGDVDLLQALPEIKLQFKMRVAIATLGRDGTLAYGADGFHYCPAFDVVAVDTTGAGDIFHAAFIYALLQGWPLKEQLEFCCAAAGLNCAGIGARGGIRPLSEIQEWMKTAKRRESTYSASFARVSKPAPQKTK